MPAGAGFTNYSKWDKLELSDDEDTHPGAKFIEANTLRRIKRESHEVREQERQEKLQKLQAAQAADDKAFRALEAQITQLSTSGEEAAAEAARATLWAQQKAMDSRAAEVAKLERERKFNADEMCYVSAEKSLVGSAACKPDVVKPVSYEDYIVLHKPAMDEYAKRVRSFDENESFFAEHPQLLSEHAMGYLLMEALQLGMDNKLAAMKRVVRQKYHLKSILDFAEASKAPPQSLVRGFFARLSSDDRVAAEYDKAFEQLFQALVKRAAEKRLEREAELRAMERAAAEEEGQSQVLSREERLGPGGLDPVKVFQSLPEPLQDAFEAKDTEALRAFIDSLPTDQAKLIMRRMVAAGLWVPEPGQEGTLLHEEEE